MIVILGIIIFHIILVIIAVSASNESKKYDKEDDLKLMLIASKTNLSLCNDFNNKLLKYFEKYQDKILVCQNSLQSLEFNNSIFKSQLNSNIKGLRLEMEMKDKELKLLIDELNSLRDAKVKEFEILKSEYYLLASKSANNLCCKAKIDNSKINYYAIENHKVLCLEKGTLKISC